MIVGVNVPNGCCCCYSIDIAQVLLQVVIFMNSITYSCVLLK